jgi:integrase
MEQKFEQVINPDGTPEEYFFRRRYRSVSGKWTRRYTAKFTDWRHIRRTFALGENEKKARAKLQDLLNKNESEVNFDTLKAERAARGLTFGKWAVENKFQVSEWHLNPLVAFFGDRLLSVIDDEAVEKYREKRSADKMIRHGKASKKTVSQTTINKELSTLRKLLRMARKKGIHDKVTVFPIEKEPSRNRTLTAAECKKLLEKCPAWLRRVVAMAYETSLSRSDLLELKWQEIDLEQGLIERARNKTTEHDVQHIIPIVTPELWNLIEELQAERRRVRNMDGLVFTIDGQPIPKVLFEYWFRATCKKAGLKNFRFHDLRHCAISRWAAAGIPTAAAMQAAGHKSVASHKKYQNLQRDELRNAFLKLSQNCLQENPQEKKTAASD